MKERKNRILLSIVLSFALILTSVGFGSWDRVMAEEVNLADYGVSDGKVTATCTQTDGCNTSDGYYEYSINVNNQSGKQINDWVAVASVGSAVTSTKTVSWSSWAEVSCVQSGTTLYIYPNTKAGKNGSISAGSSMTYSKFGYSSSQNSGTIQSVTVYYTTNSNGFSEVIGSLGGKSSTGSGDGVGSSNTYLAGYQCNYTLTGKTKNISTADTPVGKHGALHVNGTQLTDEHGKAFTLRGASTHGMQWDVGYNYVTKEGFQNLRDEWGVNMVRLVSYVTQGGYTQGTKNQLDSCIQKGVSYADELGMYALIDWHIHNESPVSTQSDAITFFDKYSKMYADHKNVLYEICNEPTGTPWATIKTYAEKIVQTIRANDPDAIIIVGTNTWSQDVDEVATGGGKLTDKNVMYTFHFYAGTHKEAFRQKVSTALAAGTPVFVTEFGICDASGNGSIDVDEATKWIDFLEQKGISYCCWALTNKDESASYFSPLSSKTSGWTNDDLGATGAWLVNTYRALQDQEEGTDTRATQAPSATQNPVQTNKPVVPTATPMVTPTASPSGSYGGTTQDGGEILFANGGTEESYEMNTPAWFNAGKDTDQIVVTYTCDKIENSEYVVMSWGAVNGDKWVDGLSYQVGTPATATYTKTYTLSEIRESLGIASTTYIKLCTYEGGRIISLVYEPTQVLTPTEKPPVTPTDNPSVLPTVKPTTTPTTTITPTAKPTTTPTVKPTTSSTGKPVESSTPAFSSNTATKKKAVVKLKKKKIVLRKGKKAKIKIKSKQRGDKVKKYKLSKKKIVKVNKKGVIKALRRGKVNITVIMKSGAKATCKVTVKK